MRAEAPLTRAASASGPGHDPDVDIAIRPPDPTASSRHSPEHTICLTDKQIWRIWAASRPAAGEHWTTLFSRLETIQKELGIGDDFPRCANCELGAGHDGPCPRSALE